MGAVVVHPVDNLLRPYLIGGRVKLSTLYVFFALIGGLKAFGPLGLFIGPLILAVTVALLAFVREEGRAGNWSLQFHPQQEEEIVDQISSTHPQESDPLGHSKQSRP
jgi:predicted PurR-regulated permease PerM